MKIFSSKKRAAAIGAVTAATVLGGTVAFAYWTTSGSGNGSAKAGDGAVWSVTVDKAGGSLAPTSETGIPNQVVNYSISNTLGTGVQRLSQAEIVIDSVTPEDGKTCGTGNFGLNGANSSVTHTFGPGGEGVDLAVGDDPVEGAVTVRLINSTSNQDGCKNATVNLKVTAS